MYSFTYDQLLEYRPNNKLLFLCKGQTVACKLMTAIRNEYGVKTSSYIDAVHDTNYTIGITLEKSANKQLRTQIYHYCLGYVDALRSL